MHYAHVPLTIKARNPTTRTLTGIASTRNPDRQADIFEPGGATFANPLPLLLQHDTARPVGHAILTATADAILFEASLPAVETPGPLRDRINEAWDSIQAGLIRGVSIGYRALKDGVKPLKTGGLHFLKTEICELSLVTIPANIEATILTVKRFDTAPPSAAIGLTLPGATGQFPRGRAMTTAEQITAFENKRAASEARMTALMQTAADASVTLDEPQTKEYDDLALEVKNVDAHLVRLRALEKAQAAQAQPVVIETRTRMPVISVKANVPPESAFIRYCQAMAVANGNRSEAAAYARHNKAWENTPEVELVLKAAIAAGTTTDATWAGPLAALRPLSDAFLELLRPATILGKIPGFRRVPFNVSVPSQTGGGSYSWVGQGAPKPVSKLQFGTVSLGITKCAGIIVITEELARNSTPDAEQVIRTDMINGIAYFLDVEFTDPTKAAAANVSPGSVTNGVTPITSAGTSPANGRTDIAALIGQMTAAGLSVSSAVLLMSESNAAVLSNSLNALGQPLFPNVAATGGSALGVPVIASQAVGANVILVHAPSILLADDGGVTIDVSREASVQMDSAPMAVPDATVVLTSLWQMNYVGLRAERFINWKKARTGAVSYTVQTYVG